MGWGRTLLLGDIGNRLDIEDTERDIENLKIKIKEKSIKDFTQDEKISILMQENDELKLYFASLIRLLTAKGNITIEELNRVVNSVDSADGKSDGKFDGKIV